jgi:beta-lactamase superfamily II metal-dependent hydrolase
VTFKRCKTQFALGLFISLLLIVSGCGSDTQPIQAVAHVSATPVRETTVTPGKSLQVSFIDVGQADSILIQIPNGKNILIDTGNNDDYETIRSYLTGQGVKQLDTLILTHMHEDHIGSSSQLITSLDIHQVVMPKQTATTQTFKNLINALNQKNLKPVQAKVGLKFDLGSEANGEFLAPIASSYEDANDYSAVFRLVYGKSVFLFTGDAEATSESQMVSQGYFLKADVLKISHHGSSSSTATAFLQKVAPKYAVISVGAGNSYEHPASTTLAKLKNSGVEIYRTDTTGTIVCESDGINISIRTLGKTVQPMHP